MENRKRDLNQIEGRRQQRVISYAGGRIGAESTGIHNADTRSPEMQPECNNSVGFYNLCTAEVP